MARLVILPIRSTAQSARSGKESECRSSRCPQHPSLDDGAHFGNVELSRHMAKRRVENATFSMLALPDDRHRDAFNPRRMFAGESRGGEHLIRGIDMHVILLRFVRKAGRDPGHDWVIRL